MKRAPYHIIYLCLLTFFLVSCQKEGKDNELILMASYPVDIPECSGLSFYGEHLLTVSDSLSKVYMISKAGKVLDSMSFAGNNLEGVVYNPVNQHTYIVEENSNEVVEIDASGLEMNRFFVKLDNLIKKHGLEGISLDLSSGHLYLVSEMAPGLLIKCTLTGEEVKRTNLAFAQDYSSVFFDDVQQKIWILSEDSKTLTRCNLNGNPEKTWFTNIKKGEGLVIDVPNNRIYIITDEVSILYVFSF